MATSIRRSLNPLLGAALLLSAACGSEANTDSGPASIQARADYSEVAEALQGMIEREHEQKELRALSIALVDGDDVVWAAGFGEQDAETGQPASAETVYRVGSVSKLFTDIAVMQLVESGEVDLDAPVQSYVPTFAPDNPTATAITLRQLMSHRSGLIREPPAGHYFDDSGTDLAATVASLNGTQQIYPPTTRQKYSNAGIAVVGYTLEVTQDEPFTEYVKRSVLEPLGMTNSAFTPDPDVIDDLADAYMWGFDRDLFAAPTFELGMSPAGSMYSTVLDLSRFMSAMFRRGEGENGRILSEESLEAMWEPQFADPGATNGYGLGFGVGERDGERWLGHGGAIYGFSTQLAFLPDAGLGVIVVSAVDGTGTVVDRVAEAALDLMRAARDGEPLPLGLLEGTDPIDPAQARALDGVFESDAGGFEFDERGGSLFMTPLRGGATVEVRSRGDTLIVDDRLSFGTKFVQDGSALLFDGDPSRRLERRPAGDLPAPPPAHWEGLIGEYGWDHNVLFILEREGQLHALIEWFFLYPLEEVTPDVYAFPDWGLYHGEQLVFERDTRGRATTVEAASVDFVRRDVGTEAGGTFRIDPVRPVAELRAEALAATPPDESGTFRDSELVEVASLAPGIFLDMRYATTNNFMSSVFYDIPRLFLQRPAAEGVVRAHQALAEHGYGLLLHDGYRPWYVTKMFWDATPESEKIFVANPANGSRHNRGAAIDLNLYDLATGEPVDMTGTYDEFSPRSFPYYPGGSARQRALRDLLRHTMDAEGFTVYEAEWWHFDHDDWRQYGIQNATFDQLGG